MAKKSSAAFKLRKHVRGGEISARPSVNNGRGGSSVGVAPGDGHKTPFYLKIRTFVFVFIVGFIVGIVPDIIEFKNAILQESRSDSLANVTGPFTKEEWYSLDDRQLPAHIRDKYVTFGEDDVTREFLANSTLRSRRPFTQFARGLARALLVPFYSKTSIAGILNNEMFVFSDAQFLSLIGQEDRSTGTPSGQLLDLGAGIGSVTRMMSGYFEETSVTEVSRVMIRQLRHKGYSIEDANLWHTTGKRYDVIACLNLLDRCAEPISMLGNIRVALRPGGYVIVSLVLPYKPYVEQGKADNRPDQHLPLQGATFEHQVASFVDDVLHPHGYQLVKVTKLPYFSEGNRRKPFFRLDAAIFVIKLAT